VSNAGGVDDTSATTGNTFPNRQRDKEEEAMKEGWRSKVPTVKLTSTKKEQRNKVLRNNRKKRNIYNGRDAPHSP